MVRSFLSKKHRLMALPILILILVGLASCSSEKIVFIYPDEALDFRLRNLKMPAVYIDTVTDMRPPEQREGEGHFFTVTYPKDKAWEVPATQVYAEALAQDLAQTHLVELVALHAQADYVLSVDLFSMACRLERSPAAALVTAAIGGAVGMAMGEDSSQRLKYGVALGAITMLAIPVPTNNHAEADVRLTLKDRTGNVVWQKSCLGEVDDKKYMSNTARQDQQLVDELLTKAVKRANACLLGQLRQYLLDEGQPAPAEG